MLFDGCLVGSCQTMIEFTTLFLGLLFGTRTVELAVEGPVAAVEVRLDEQIVGRIEAPPWTIDVDFGDRLVPRLLEAFAFDARGRQLANTRQLINYGRSNHEAVLVLEPRASSGRVVWQAIFGQSPSSIQLSFDDRRIPVTMGGHFTLPPHDPGESHFLTARLVFPDGFATRAEMSFGDAFGERVTSALTAVPILVPPGTGALGVEEVQGWFESGEDTPRVFSTAATGAELLIVRDRKADGPLRRLTRNLSAVDLAEIPTDALTVSFVATYPHRDHSAVFQIFEASPQRTATGLWPLLTELHPWRERQRQTLWSSAAAAARGAAESNARRAVLLLLASRSASHRGIGPAQIVEYLQSVRVPLFLWTPERRFEKDLQRKVEVDVYVGAPGMEALFRDLADSLASQRIIWLEGEYRPNHLRLSDRAPPGVRLVE